MSKATQSQIPQWVMDWSLILGLVVLLVTFVNYGMSFLYPSPEYQDFCGHDQYQVAPVQIETEAACLEAGGAWNDDAVPRRIADQSPEATTTAITGYCDRDYSCSKAYNSASDAHDRNGLVIMLILGLALAVFGFLRKQSDIISSSFSIAGVIVILSGLIRYWSISNDWAQFILLGSSLLVFIYLAISRR